MGFRSLLSVYNNIKINLYRLEKFKCSCILHYYRNRKWTPESLHRMFYGVTCVIHLFLLSTVTRVTSTSADSVPGNISVMNPGNTECFQLDRDGVLRRTFRNVPSTQPIREDITVNSATFLFVLFVFPPRNTIITKW